MTLITLTYEMKVATFVCVYIVFVLSDSTSMSDYVILSKPLHIMLIDPLIICVPRL